MVGQQKYIDINININMEIQFGERVGHGSWLIGPKLFWPGLHILLSFASLFILDIWVLFSSLKSLNQIVVVESVVVGDRAAIHIEPPFQFEFYFRL